MSFCVLTENDDKDDSPVDSPPNRNVEKGWSLWDLVRGGWNVREGPSSPTPDSNPPIRPGQGDYIRHYNIEIFFVFVTQIIHKLLLRR